jgi:primosomal protein N''
VVVYKAENQLAKERYLWYDTEEKEALFCEGESMYADIIIDITHEKVDKVFQYKIPLTLKKELCVGDPVIVPFGRGNKERQGYVVSFSKHCNWEADKIKEILRVAEAQMNVETKMIALAHFIKSHYGGTMIQALKTVIPIRKKENAKEEREILLEVSMDEAQSQLEIYRSKNQKARARLLEAVIQQAPLPYTKAIKQLSVSLSVVKSLEEAGIARVATVQVERNPIMQEQVEKKVVEYTSEQKAAIRTICEEYTQGIRSTYLLHGITGSGKTEVYMEAIESVIAKKRQVIVLIPEISLTYQTVRRFYQRFGNRISIMNSRLSQGERYDQTMRAKRGEIDIMIGPRSALFTPFSNLGLIIIDEEHEASYKSEQMPRYHAREVAIYRAQMESASVILGSATPSIEAYAKGQSGEYKLLKLANRVGNQTLPQTYIVDLMGEMRKGNRSMFSEQLMEMLRGRLAKREQVILFINRRGYAGFISCRACGYVVKCPHCDVSLTEHRNGKLLCHYCGYDTRILKHCPTCNSKHIGGMKVGTQQIETLLHKEFPEARVLRMDKDTTTRKHDYENILRTFGNGEADILIGTQMIVKGHDFPQVTLVGILLADVSLYANDYRAGEKTFQLLTQAAGRAGRGEIKGEVVIQTYSPEHYSILAAAKQDYEGFYEEEITYRSLAGYPPETCLVGILLTSKEEALLEQAAHYLAKYAKQLAKAHKGKRIQIIGPSVPFVQKTKDAYRQAIYVKAMQETVAERLVKQLEKYIEVNEGFTQIHIQFDFNPLNIW